MHAARPLKRVLYLHTVDVQDAQVVWYEAEVDDVRKRPDDVASRQSLEVLLAQHLQTQSSYQDILLKSAPPARTQHRPGA